MSEPECTNFCSTRYVTSLPALVWQSHHHRSTALLQKHSATFSCYTWPSLVHMSPHANNTVGHTTTIADVIWRNDVQSTRLDPLGSISRRREAWEPWIGAPSRASGHLPELRLQCLEELIEDGVDVVISRPGRGGDTGRLEAQFLSLPDTPVQVSLTIG